MADITNLTSFLDDVAAAIKTKKGYQSSQKILAENFDTEIASIVTVNNQNKTITPTTSQQTITADQGYTGIGTATVNAVTSAIDQNIVAGNIKKNVVILGVTGSFEGAEDLTNVLNAQDTKIAELEAAVNNKAGLSGGKPNIFVQLEEPEKEKGIWLKTDEIAEHYISDPTIMPGIADTWSEDGQLTDIPYRFFGCPVVSVGTDAYLLGGDTSGNYNYKYDTLTDTYTKMTNIPFTFQWSSALAINTDIYLFGSSYGGYGSYAYKYDTLTNTYTRLSNIPYTFNCGALAAVGKSIYLIGGNNSGTYNYRYDIDTDTYTQMSNIPYAFDRGGAVGHGTDIYLFGSRYNSTYTYKYDTLTDTYTRLTDVPYTFVENPVVKRGDKVYLLGSSVSSYMKYNYVYDINTDTYTKLTDIPYNFDRGGACNVNNIIYIFGR